MMDCCPLGHQDDRVMRVSTLYLQGFSDATVMTYGPGGIALGRQVGKTGLSDLLKPPPDLSRKPLWWRIIVPGGITLWYNIFARRRIAKKRDRYERAMGFWNQLLYCGLHNVAFLPGQPYYIEVTSNQALVDWLYSLPS